MLNTTSISAMLVSSRFMFTPISAITGAADAVRAWCSTTRRSLTPLARAVRTKSSWSVPESWAAVIRVHAPASGAPMITHGIQMLCTNAPGRLDGAR